MPGYKRIPKEIKDEVLTAIASGEKVIEVADRFGISRQTIYSWIANSTTKGASALEISRLKRENEALKFLVGEFALQIKKQGKKRRGSCYA